MKKGIENPITKEIEHRNGKAWGAGGPNAFIRNNEYLNNIVQAIKKGTPDTSLLEATLSARASIKS